MRSYVGTSGSLPSHLARVHVWVVAAGEPPRAPLAVTMQVGEIRICAL